MSRHPCRPRYDQGHVGDEHQCEDCGKRWRYQPQHVVLSPGWYSLLDLRLRRIGFVIAVLALVAFMVGIVTGWLPSG